MSLNVCITYLGLWNSRLVTLSATAFSQNNKMLITLTQYLKTPVVTDVSRLMHHNPLHITQLTQTGLMLCVYSCWDLFHFKTIGWNIYSNASVHANLSISRFTTFLCNPISHDDHLTARAWFAYGWTCWNRDLLIIAETNFARDV